MKQQQHVDLVPRYLPYNPYAADPGEAATLRIANKTGFFPGFRGDVGLLKFSGKAVVFAALAAGGTDRTFASESSTARRFGKVGQVIWAYFGTGAWGSCLMTDSA